MRSEVYDRLCLLASNGSLSAEAVVADAADVSSPLHTEFDWDDASAAHTARIDRARELIRAVKVEITTTRRTVRSVAYVHDPRLSRNEPGYLHVEYVKRQPTLVTNVLDAEVAQILSLLDRAVGLALGLGDQHAAAALTEVANALRTRWGSNGEKR
jgi:hypothetical protein